MPIIQTDIIAEAIQHDGRQRGRARYHFSEGDVVDFDFNMHPPGTDFAALAAAKIPAIEAEVKQRELVLAEEFLLNGGTIAQVQAKKKYNTNAEIGTYILKRVANRLPDITRVTLEKDLADLFLLRNIFAEITDIQISNLLGVTVAAATAWRVSFTDFVNGTKNYGHGFPFYLEVEL